MFQLPSGSLAITVELRSTPVFLSSVECSENYKDLEAQYLFRKKIGLLVYPL